MSCNSKEVPFKNDEKNQLKYVSTYKMGQIGITKLIEEPFKSSLTNDNNQTSKRLPKNIKIKKNFSILLPKIDNKNM